MARQAGVPYIEESPMFKQLEQLKGFLTAEAKVDDK